VFIQRDLLQPDGLHFIDQQPGELQLARVLGNSSASVFDCVLIFTYSRKRALTDFICPQQVINFYSSGMGLPV
jgi:hypothetical protein